MTIREIIHSARLDQGYDATNPVQDIADSDGNITGVQQVARRPLIYYLKRELVYALRFNLVCLFRGHDWDDDDPGDPEVGPDPHIYCRRCGRG